MKLKILDIPEEGMDLQASFPAQKKPKRYEDEWFGAVVCDSFGELLPEKNEVSMELHVLRTVDNVQIAGKVVANLRPTCDRCAEFFDAETTLPLQVYLAPHKDMHFEKGEEDEGLGENDVAFSFYKGNEVDLNEIVREMILLEMPVRHLCSEDCKGLCAKCGQNLNFGNCDCDKKKIDPRLAVLQNIKLKSA